MEFFAVEFPPSRTPPRQTGKPFEFSRIGMEIGFAR
jgi:hypothetical protein